MQSLRLISYSRTLTLLCATLLLLSACAGPVTSRHLPAPALLALEQQQQLSLALAQQMASQQRVLNLSWPLLAAAADLCGDATRPSMGFRFSNKYGVEEKYRDTAIRDLGLGEALQVTQVVAGSPAAQAGLLTGDTLVALDGRTFGAGPTASTSISELLGTLDSTESVKLLVSRQSRQLELTIRPAEICKYPVLIAGDDTVNAWADGDSVVLTRGILRFASDDRDLALVIAHELAHNAYHHVPKIIGNALSGTLLDLLALGYGIPSPGLFTWAGSRVHMQDFEAEADYIALYLLARREYPLDGVADFWRRVAAEYPDQINNGLISTHPSSPARFLALEATVREIRRKQRLGQPLNPHDQQLTAQ